MKSFFPVCILFIFMAGQSLAQNSMEDKSSHTDLVQTSQQLLLAAKRHDATDSLTAVLSHVTAADLAAQLPDDDHKKAFWINIYNAYTQIVLSKSPGMYRNRHAFFGSRQIPVAGKYLSLDDIEHGILRRSKIKWSLGYCTKWFPSAFEKANRVDTLDYRIHFSLNCGAKSCPPIAFYTPQQINKQLDAATRTYLKNETDYHAAENKIYLPTMMGWFRHDFGGKKKMQELLHNLQVLQPGQDPAIRFKKYDWNLFLENYNTE